jgi:TonB family protein
MKVKSFIAAMRHQISRLLFATLIATVWLDSNAQSSLPRCPANTNVVWSKCAGTFVQPNGEMYVGDWLDDMKHGWGAHTRADGTKYVGQFQRSKRHGEGIHYSANGTVRSSGLWANDKLTRSFAIDFNRFPFTSEGPVSSTPNKAASLRLAQAAASDQTPPLLPQTAKIGRLPSTDLFYPAAARRESRQGSPVIYACVDANSILTSVKVKTPSGHADLDEAATFIAKQAPYKAGTSAEGNPVPSCVSFRIKFDITPDTSVQSNSTPMPAVRPATQKQSRRVALVIGNAAYANAPALTNPPNDAATVSTALREAGFDTVTVRTNLSQQATLNALREFASLADTADWAVVYYAGHGIESGGNNYLIPVDARLQTDRDIDLEGVDLGKVMSAVEGAKRLRLIILDACRDNPFANQMRRTMASRSIGRGLARVEPEPGTLVAYAAKHGETADDGTGTRNSPFAEAFVKRIKQTPPIEVRRLFDYVRDDVLKATNKRQQPFSYGSISAEEDFYFLLPK